MPIGIPEKVPVPVPVFFDNIPVRLKSKRSRKKEKKCNRSQSKIILALRKKQTHSVSKHPTGKLSSHISYLSFLLDDVPGLKQEQPVRRAERGQVSSLRQGRGGIRGQRLTGRFRLGGHITSIRIRRKGSVTNLSGSELFLLFFFFLWGFYYFILYSVTV